MGLEAHIERWRAARRERAVARAAERDRRAAGAVQRRYESDLAAWEAEVESAREALEVAEEFSGFTAAEAPDEVPLLLRRGETVYLVVDGVALVETRRQRGSYQGGSRGASVRVAKGVRFHVGGHRGTYVPGPEEQTAIDEGRAVVTSTRVVFQGDRQTREWSYATLVGIDEDEPGLTLLHVSNRQKASGILHGEEAATPFRFRLGLAVARFHGQHDTFVARAKRHLRRIEALRPHPPANDRHGAARHDIR